MFTKHHEIVGERTLGFTLKIAPSFLNIDLWIQRVTKIISETITKNYVWSHYQKYTETIIKSITKIVTKGRATTLIKCSKTNIVVITINEKNDLECRLIKQYNKEIFIVFQYNHLYKTYSAILFYAIININFETNPIHTQRNKNSSNHDYNDGILLFIPS